MGNAHGTPQSASRGCCGHRHSPHPRANSGGRANCGRARLHAARLDFAKGGRCDRRRWADVTRRFRRTLCRHRHRRFAVRGDDRSPGMRSSRRRRSPQFGAAEFGRE
jgi:hypothetical protein